MFTAIGISDVEPTGQGGCGYTFDTPEPNKEPEMFSMFGTTFRGSQIIRTPAAEDAKPHFKRSLIAAAIAPPLVLLPFLAIDITFMEGLVLAGPLAYAGWSIYWGLVGLGNFTLKEAELSPGWERVIHGLVDTLGEHPAVAAAIVVGYSMFGGGIHEFRKYRRIASNLNVDSE